MANQKKVIDYEALYGIFNSSAERKAERDAKFVDKLAHKAYNLPIDDDVNINHTTNVSGMNWKHLLAGGAGLSGLGAVGLLASMLFQRPAPAPEPTPIPPVIEPAEPVTQNFKVRFWDQHGAPFDYIPHRKAKGQQAEGETKP